MIRQPPKSTPLTHSCPTRRSSDLQVLGEIGLREGLDAIVMGLGAADHALAPPVVDHAGIDLGARPVEAVERPFRDRSEEHTSELQSLMRISYAVFCLKKKRTNYHHNYTTKEANQQQTTTYK